MSRKPADFSLFPKPYDESVLLCYTFLRSPIDGRTLHSSLLGGIKSLVTKTSCRTGSVFMDGMTLLASEFFLVMRP